MQPSRAIKRVVERVIKKVVDGIDKKTEQKLQQSIDVPVTIPSQNAKTSKLIHIKYELKVEIKLGALYKNLILTAPIIIGNVPIFVKEPEQTVLRSSIPQPMPMPLDANSRASVFSNWSLDLYPQIGVDQSAVRNSILYPTASPVIAVMPMSHPSYPMLPVLSTSPSILSSTVMNTNLPQDRQSINFPPSAPPIDFANANASTPIRPHSLFINRPPSYDEAMSPFSEMARQFSQLNMSNQLIGNQNASTKS